MDSGGLVSGNTGGDGTGRAHPRDFFERNRNLFQSLCTSCNVLVRSVSMLPLEFLGNGHSIGALDLPIQVLSFKPTAFAGSEVPGEIALAR